MTLRSTTLANAADRRRFVTERAAFPYLRNRERQNALRDFREALRALDEARRASVYGTDRVLTMAMRIGRIAQCLERSAATLRALPTIVEMKAATARREQLNRWRAAQQGQEDLRPAAPTAETAVASTVTDRLAAD